MLDMHQRALPLLITVQLSNCTLLHVGMLWLVVNGMLAPHPISFSDSVLFCPAWL